MGEFTFFHKKIPFCQSFFPTESLYFQILWEKYFLHKKKALPFYDKTFYTNILFYFPEQIIQRHPQLFADCYAKVNAGVVVAFFNRVDCLAAYTYCLGQIVLRQIFKGPGRFKL